MMHSNVQSQVINGLSDIKILDKKFSVQSPLSINASRILSSNTSWKEIASFEVLKKKKNFYEENNAKIIQTISTTHINWLGPDDCVAILNAKKFRIKYGCGPEQAVYKIIYNSPDFLILETKGTNWTFTGETVTRRKKGVTITSEKTKGEKVIYRSILKKIK